MMNRIQTKKYNTSLKAPNTYFIADLNSYCIHCFSIQDQRLQHMSHEYEAFPILTPIGDFKGMTAQCRAHHKGHKHENTPHIIVLSFSVMNSKARSQYFQYHTNEFIHYPFILHCFLRACKGNY